MGAHISIIYPHESQQYGINKIAECGEIIRFTPKKCEVVYAPLTWKKMDEVYLIMVDAPELNRIRAKYGIPGMPQGYDFHITIGVKPKVAQAAQGARAA